MKRTILYIGKFFLRREPLINNKTYGITNYNKKVGTAFTVSKDGVLKIDLNNQEFRKHLFKQLRKTKKEH
jgi:hypothetical protein